MLACTILSLGLTPLAASTGQAETITMTHRMMLLVMQLGLILLAAKFGKLLFEKIKLPGVLGELAAGMIIGPYALGQIALPGFLPGLFPLGASFPVSPELYGLASVAAIVLLFTVGLETNVKLFRQYSLAGGAVGLGGVVVSFLVGDLVTMLFSRMLFGQQLGFLAPECLFLGAISTATSVGITARILSEKRKMDSPEGVTILSGAVIDDVLGIIVFAVVVGMVTASKATGTVNWGHIGLIAARAIGIWLVATILGLIASRRISTLLKLFGERSSIALMSLGLALILSALFEEAGLAMIIGAYIMGLSLSKTDISNVVRERLHPIYQFLTPVFFCVMGMLIDFRAMGSGTVLLFGAVYTISAIAAKMVGCGIPPLLLNFNLRGAVRVSMGMIPRGEVALIIAGVGLAAGVLGPEIFAAAILMTVVTTLVAPPMLVLSFISPREGVRQPVATVDEQTTSVRFELPSVEMADFFIGKLWTAFESDGFFVHRLSHEQHLYQIRKEDIIIDFQRVGTSLAFGCQIRDVPLVNTSVLEAAASVEQAISGLSQPLDMQAIRTNSIEGKCTPVGQAAILRKYLTPDLIKPKLSGITKNDVIDEMIGILSRKGLIKDRKQAVDAVLAREQSMSTGMENGVAIPHAKTDAVDRLVCAVGIKKKKGLDWGSVDGQPSYIFVLMLSPKQKSTPHLQFMAAVSQVLTESVRSRLLACKTSQEAYRILTSPAT